MLAEQTTAPRISAPRRRDMMPYLLMLMSQTMSPPAPSGLDMVMVPRASRSLVRAVVTGRTAALPVRGRQHLHDVRSAGTIAHSDEPLGPRLFLPLELQPRPADKAIQDRHAAP